MQENGIDALLAGDGAWLRGRRFGLIAHAASIDAAGASSAGRLRAAYGEGLAALFSPEHGFSGAAGPGEKVASARHPAWGIPVYSLYGATRRPAPAMLRGLDALVYDLQDLSIRCYTYVSTLRQVMEAAARARIPVLVLDRGNPLMGVVDGPMLEARFESFVGSFPGPLVYGLTSGQAARRLARVLRLRIDLEVVGHGEATWSGHRWVSPSPGIRSPHTAWCYPVTVGFEALPAVDYGRPGLLPFELIGCQEVDEQAMADRLNGEELPGMAFHPVVYEQKGVAWRGVRIAVHDPAAYRPVAAAVAVLEVVQGMIGARRLWRTKGSRPAFFDRLFGTDTVRRGVQAGVSWRVIARGWEPALRRWRKELAR